MRPLAPCPAAVPVRGGQRACAGAGPSLDAALKRRAAEQRTADADAARLEQAASQARTEAARLHAQQAAAAQAIAAAEARITRRQCAAATGIGARSRPTASGSRPSSSRRHRCSPAWRTWRAGRRCCSSPMRRDRRAGPRPPAARCDPAGHPQRTGRLSAKSPRASGCAVSACREPGADAVAWRAGRPAAALRRAGAQEHPGRAGDGRRGAQRWRQRAGGGRDGREAARRAGEQPVDPRGGRRSSPPNGPAPASPFQPESQPQRLPFAYQLPAAAAGHRRAGRG